MLIRIHNILRFIILSQTFSPSSSRQRALASGLPLLAGGAAFAAGTRGLCPLDSRWGFAPDPEMLTHLFLAYGRDGGLGALSSVPALLTSLPKAGQAGRFPALFF